MTVSEDHLVRIERDADVVVITLDRPTRRNAMNAALASATCAAIEAAQDARAIVLTGAGPAFCAGLDLRDPGVERITDIPPFIATTAASRVPVVAAVNGPAVAGGLELALACDFIVASERARFADTHLRVGVYPGPVAVQLPRRVGSAWAREMSLTGNFVDAATALRIGLVNHVVSSAELLDVAGSLAVAIADQDPAMVAALRQDWRENDGLPADEALEQHYEHAARGGFHGAVASTITERRDQVLRRAHADDRHMR
ncbi:enoyl-CoA hydratase-related protein [Nocardioides panzhihuensis]|uniref:Enoyl-CoA hydratase n=1 Tax=Nocardioides panzhihuensis TaxID=860243 RepID=A0A7Z0DMM9_9ACTN|nr:enoyl-CoA hydratase-related protein [Nocardioides panzhihuensis]NYI78278.1 enoyl-CoA hydratase [Nocardioides panzhihuensis]